MGGERNGRASSPTSPSSSPSRELSSSALRAPAAVLAVCCLLVAIAMSSDDRNAYYYLGADLGGTNFRVALYKTSRAGEDPAAPIFTHHYRNLDHGGVEEMLADFLHQSQSAGFASDGIDAAAISVAGAVANNSCNMTNLDETVDGDALSRRLGIRGGVTLINDFVGAGYGLLTLQPSEYITLQEGEPAEGAPVALVGAGTGLGECFVTRDARGEPTCWPSEGGHAEWAPRTPMELELAQWLMAKYSQQGSARRVSVERLVSGSGLADIYEWLATEKFPERAAPEVLRRVREGRKDERPVTVAQCAGESPLSSTLLSPALCPAIPGAAACAKERSGDDLPSACCSRCGTGGRRELGRALRPGDGHVPCRLRLRGRRRRSQVAPLRRSLHRRWNRSEAAGADRGERGGGGGGWGVHGGLPGQGADERADGQGARAAGPR